MEDWFEDVYSSPYMLHTFKIKEDKRKQIPAIAHLDSTSRIQSVSQKTDEFLYEVIHAFKEKTGIPILCNTSLNDLGEPIINKIEQALNFALRKRLTIVYINGKRLILHNHDLFLENKPSLRKPIVSVLDEEKEKLINNLNPHKLNKDELGTYYTTPKLHNHLDISNDKDVRIIKKYAKMKSVNYILMSRNMGIVDEDANAWIMKKLTIAQSME